jgi:hypothetical protein
MQSGKKRSSTKKHERKAGSSRVKVESKRKEPQEAQSSKVKVKK